MENSEIIAELLDALGVLGGPTEGKNWGIHAVDSVLFENFPPKKDRKIMENPQIVIYTLPFHFCLVLSNRGRWMTVPSLLSG